MADTVIKMDTIREKMKAMSTDKEIEKKIEEAYSTVPPSNSDSYSIQEVAVVAEPMKTVTDFATASQKHPKYGGVLAFNILADMDRAKPGMPVLLPQCPQMFVSSTSLEGLKERMIFEIDKAIEIAKIAEKHPLEHDKVARAFMEKLAAARQPDGQ